VSYPKKIVHWIGDKEIDSKGKKFFAKHNSATGEVLAEVARGNHEDAKAAIKWAESAYGVWAGTPVAKRSKILLNLALLIHKRRDELAEIVAIESGKPKKIALQEVDAAVKCGLFFVKEGSRIFNAREKLVSATAGRKVELVRQPTGVGALITPFNNPSTGVAWKLFPALLCGNTVIVKSHEYTPYIAIWYAKALQEAGIPAGVMNVVQGLGREAGRALVKDERVTFVSFTGSFATGADILKNTAERLAKVSIEAGGKNPFVVCDDADLDRAADIAVDSAFIDAGQRCSAASRIIVSAPIYDEFKKIFLEKVSCLKVGVTDDCDYGAMISKKRMNFVLRAVDTATKRGAKVLTGGKRLDGQGYFIEPTVLENLSMDEQFSQEEIFGPAVVLYRAKDFQDALRLANFSRFKLSGAIHTKSAKRAQDFIQRYVSGVVRVNGPTHGSEPHMPFGGVGLSGNGWREPGSKALDFYADWKQVSYERIVLKKGRVKI